MTVLSTGQQGTGERADAVQFLFVVLFAITIIDCLYYLFSFEPSPVHEMIGSIVKKCFQTGVRSIHSSTIEKCEHLIIGGGPVGSSIAYHLAKNGATNVVVLERDYCYRTTSAMLSAGGIRQQFSVPENIKMSMYGAEFIKNPQQLAVDGEVPDLQFHQIGYLFLSGQRSRHILTTNQKTQVDCGADWIKLMEVNALAKMFPWLNVDSIDVGTFGEQNEGYFDPWIFVGGLKKKSMSLGVKFIEGTAVGGKLQPVTQGSSSFKIDSIHYITNNNRNEVHEIHAENVVNSAGAWSGRLVENIAKGLAKPGVIKKVPVAPRKRCIFSVHCPGLQKSDYPVPSPNTPLTVDPTGVYFRPEQQQGRFICGVSPTEDNDPDIGANDEEAALRNVDEHLFNEIIWPTLAERVPAFQELKVTSSWAGFYDYNSLDQNLIIGQHSELRNMLLCTGFSGHGLQQSPGAGRGAAELLLNNNSFKTLDLSRFSFERIVDNKPIFETGIV